MGRCQSPRCFHHCCGDVLGDAVVPLQGETVRDAGKDAAKDAQGCREGCSKGCREGSDRDAVQAGSMRSSVHQGDQEFMINLFPVPFLVCRLHLPSVNLYRFKGFVSPGFVSCFPSRVSMEIERLLLWLFLVIYCAYIG